MAMNFEVMFVLKVPFLVLFLLFLCMGMPTFDREVIFLGRVERTYRTFLLRTYFVVFYMQKV